MGGKLAMLSALAYPQLIDNMLIIDGTHTQLVLFERAYIERFFQQPLLPSIAIAMIPPSMR